MIPLAMAVCSSKRRPMDGQAKLLVLTGEPIVGHGPFVMNSEAEIRQAVEDFSSGRFVTTAT